MNRAGVASVQIAGGLGGLNPLPHLADPPTSGSGVGKTFVFYRMQILSYYSISCFRQLTCSGSRPRPAVKVYEKWDCVPPRIDTLLRSPCSLNFPNLCNNCVKILVFKIRKCHQLQGGFVPLTSDLPALLS